MLHERNGVYFKVHLTFAGDACSDVVPGELHKLIWVFFVIHLIELSIFFFYFFHPDVKFKLALVTNHCCNINFLNGNVQ